MPNDDTPPQTEVDANPGLIPSSVRAEDNLGLFSFSFDNLSWQPPDMSVATLQDITDDSIEIQTPPGSDDDDSFADLYARLLDDDEPTVPYPDESWVEMDELSFISDAPTFPYGSFLSLFDPNNLGTIIAGAAEQANYDVMMAMNSMDLSSITELSVRLMLVSVVLELWVYIPECADTSGVIKLGFPVRPQRSKSGGLGGLASSMACTSK